jgi:uncharacterized protein (DUF885 family)
LQPKTKFEIRRTEAEKIQQVQNIIKEQLMVQDQGVLCSNSDVKEYNMYGDEDLFLHEAVPGHHFQISLQQENNTPDFRKYNWFGAYGEGWALYTESLGKELGLYQDPYQYFGMLGNEMHRAVRLVVDTGLHSKGWTREQAIKYSLENEAESEASITTNRTIHGYSWSTLSYKIGQLKIMQLRQKHKIKWKKFDIKNSMKSFRIWCNAAGFIRK